VWISWVLLMAGIDHVIVAIVIIIKDGRQRVKEATSK
jgi:hypothetical protein